MPTLIQFFLPWQLDGLDDVPRRAEDYWKWVVSHPGLGEGKYSWTLQTYLLLSKAGFACNLTSTFPANGIVISHRDFLPVSLPPKADVFLVCIKPDRKEHSWAQHYLVQCDTDPAHERLGDSRVDVVRFWPQPDLQPRNPARGTTCKNVAYIGREGNLAREIRGGDWKCELESLGFAWCLPPIESWHDYSEIDVTVSVREFGEQRPVDSAIFDPASKPPTKLTNSWLAGVPAIVAVEPAYMNVRRSPLDFITASSKDELRSALIALRRDPATYQAMQANGFHRASQFSTESVIDCWIDVIEKRIIPAHDAWLRHPPLFRKMVNLGRVARYFANWRNIADVLRAGLSEIRTRLTR